MGKLHDLVKVAYLDASTIVSVHHCQKYKYQLFSNTGFINKSLLMSDNADTNTNYFYDFVPGIGLFNVEISGIGLVKMTINIKTEKIQKTGIVAKLLNLFHYNHMVNYKLSYKDIDDIISLNDGNVLYEHYLEISNKRKDDEKTQIDLLFTERIDILKKNDFGN